MPVVYSLLALALPLVLFGGSLWRVLATASRLKLPQFSDAVWLGLYVLVNALSGLWALTLVKAMKGLVLPAEFLQVSSTVGAGLFLCFGLVLVARPLNAGLVRAASWLSGELKRQLIRFFCPRKRRS